MAKVAKKPESKEIRINLRAKEHEKAVIGYAAKLTHTTLTDFMLRQSFDAASQIIAEETNITMSQEHYDKLCHILDHPPRKNVAAFKRLLETPSVLDS